MNNIFVGLFNIKASNLREFYCGILMVLWENVKSNVSKTLSSDPE